jgi:hypothetical protein
MSASLRILAWTLVLLAQLGGLLRTSAVVGSCIAPAHDPRSGPRHVEWLIFCQSASCQTLEPDNLPHSRTTEPLSDIHPASVPFTIDDVQLCEHEALSTEMRRRAIRSNLRDAFVHALMARPPPGVAPWAAPTNPPSSTTLAETNSIAANGVPDHAPLPHASTHSVITPGPRAGQLAGPRAGRAAIQSPDRARAVPIGFDGRDASRPSVRLI